MNQINPAVIQELQSQLQVAQAARIACEQLRTETMHSKVSLQTGNVLLQQQNNELMLRINQLQKDLDESNAKLNSREIVSNAPAPIADPMSRLLQSKLDEAEKDNARLNRIVTAMEHEIARLTAILTNNLPKDIADINDSDGA